MTEAEWLVCNDPKPILQWLDRAQLFNWLRLRRRNRPSRRRVQLAANAILACLPAHYPDQFAGEAAARGWQLLDRLAEGVLTRAEWLAGQEGWLDALPPLAECLFSQAARVSEPGRTPTATELGVLLLFSKWTHWQLEIRGKVLCSLPSSFLNREALEAEARGHAMLIRDIFGNPFRPVTFSPSWRTDTALSLAQGMYESRDFGAMPILADALQDAGCDNDDVLNHCRGPGPHVRGCWVVDLVLGKQ